MAGLKVGLASWLQQPVSTGNNNGSLWQGCQHTCTSDRFGWPEQHPHNLLVAGCMQCYGCELQPLASLSGSSSNQTCMEQVLAADIYSSTRIHQPVVSAVFYK